MASSSLLQVAVFAPINSTLTYRAPPGMESLARPGCRVLVPLGQRGGVVGMVVAPGEPVEGTELKPIQDLLDAEPLLDDQLLQLLMWIASYYMAPPGEVIRAALPSALHSPERQLVKITDEGRRVLDAQQAVLRSESDDLSQREQEALERLAASSRGQLSLGTLQSSAAGARALSRLLERGLAAQQRKERGRFRTDLLLELSADPPVELPKNARRQRAVVEALRAAGGRARLGSLREQGATSAIAHKLAERGIVRLEQVEVPVDPFASEPAEAEPAPTLTDEQEGVLAPLLDAGAKGAFAAFLLHGVTSSGKTEVYLRLIADVMQRGRGAIVLVPEISLTPQLAARFRARFGDQVAVLHSALTEAERHGQWHLIRRGQVQIVVGARSAIFAPLRNLGVMIVDEEHDSSFKQEEGVRYNARDTALVRARAADAVAVLGSATPSTESYRGAGEGRLQLLEMFHRATPRPLPEVEIVDLRRYQTGPEGFLTAPMSQALEEVLQRGEQAILFLNRRGFSTFLLCRMCGHVFRCVQCSVSLTYHRDLDRVVCHYCGYTRAVPTRCPTCDATDGITRMGMGTEQVENGLRLRFPNARLARLDRDTAATNRRLRRILKQVSQREVDILVGTQMVTKGHDFPNVTLVGVLGADLGLNFPDFRASERTFQLLTQVAGRAGRGERPGKVIVQTYNPDHPSIRHARTHDYQAFYRDEVESRRDLLYPPWGHLAAVRLDGRDASAVERLAHELAKRLRAWLEPGAPVAILGPAEAPLQKLKGKTRWLLLLKSQERRPLRALLQLLSQDPIVAQSRGVRVTVDVDPLMML